MGGLKLLFSAVHGIFKVNGQIITQILTLNGGIGVTPPAAPAAEKILKVESAPAAESAPAEKGVEDILGVVEVGSAAATLTGVGFMTELVIAGTLFGVAQNFVGNRDLFELLFGLFVARIFIGMILDRQLAVSLFISSAEAFLATPSCS